MDEKLMESYLDNIEELVRDEDKIVTYKLLSRTLEIHVNTAKQLLYTYLSKQKLKNSGLISATYLLAGKLKDGSVNISIVNEADLKEAYSKFVEVTSEHVYSLQKSSYVKDINSLCAVNKDLPDCKSFEVIKCSKSFIKSKEESNKKINELSKESSEKVKTVANQKPIMVEETIKKAISPVKSANKSPVKESPTKNAKKTSPIDQKSKAKVDKKQTNAKVQKGNIASFFANVPKSSDANKSKNEASQKEESKPVSVSIKKEIDFEETKLSNELKHKSQSKESSKKKANTSKRKRIQILSDSEESDSSDEEPTPMEEEPEPQPAQPLVELEEDREETVESLPQNKRRRRKIVDKTVMNEDGYLETRKEVVYETDSEEEDGKANGTKEISENKKHKLDQSNEKAKSVVSKGVTKQSSLLSFFKKN